MPVYLLTVHAYRSWREDHPRGYVQHGKGLREPRPEPAQWRDGAAKHPPARFSPAQQTALQATAELIASERGARLHSLATCSTHVHLLLSFADPPCTCGTAEHCRRGCPARKHVESITTRCKQKMGQRLARDAGTRGRPWFSRGRDVTPVRGREHFDHLIADYLPDHEQTQGGLFRRYDAP